MAYRGCRPPRSKESATLSRPPASNSRKMLVVAGSTCGGGKSLYGASTTFGQHPRDVAPLTRFVRMLARAAVMAALAGAMMALLART